MIKNYFISALLFCGVSLMANAQDTKVNVLYLDGTPHVVQMSQVAKLKVSGDDVSLLAHDGSAVATHKIADVDKIELTSIATSVASLNKKQAITIRYNGSNITAEGMADGKTLDVYAADGAAVAKAVARGGKATIDVSALAAGVYVVKAEGQSLKMMKR